MRPVTPSHVERDGDATKFLLTLEDGLQAESVLLRIEGLRRTRTTLCVSSQIGCALGCTFCETAMMGLHRNLDSEEILDQWRAATGSGSRTSEIPCLPHGRHPGWRQARGLVGAAMQIRVVRPHATPNAVAGSPTRGFCGTRH